MAQKLSDATQSVIGTGVTALANLGAAIGQNSGRMKYDAKKYYQQRQDNETIWHKQNAYNSPLQQMERLKEAGLNPNLVYGNGATTTAGSINSQTPEPTKQEPYHIPQETFTKYFDVKQQSAQTDLLRQQLEVQKQDAYLKAIQGANIAQQTATGKFDLGLKQKLEENSLQFAHQNLKNLEGQTVTMYNRDTREASKLQGDQIEQAFRNSNINADTKNKVLSNDELNEKIHLLKSENYLKDIEVKLAEKGIYKNDPAWVRIISQLAESLIGTGTATNASPIVGYLLQSIPGLLKIFKKR